MSHISEEPIGATVIIIPHSVAARSFTTSSINSFVCSFVRSFKNCSLPSIDSLRDQLYEAITRERKSDIDSPLYSPEESRGFKYPN